MSTSLKLSQLLPLCVALGLLLILVGNRRELALLAAMCVRRTSKVRSVAECEEVSLLDLPELAIESVLSKLPPQSLGKVASVCKELHTKCSSDHLWLPHVQSKWGHIICDSAFKEWESDCSHIIHVHANPCKSDDITPLCKPFIGWSIFCLWSPWTKSPSYPSHKHDTHISCMRWYAALETGAFWFPAQVYNREHGHVGFLLSCYDAELCYDRQTDTFTASYPPHGSCSPLLEEGVSWQRLRAPPVHTTAHELFVSSSVKDLRPGDHVEVQWRRNKMFPYGWWYGVVGHVDTCNRDSQHCQCHLEDLVWLEFNQYEAGSRWRRTAVNRTLHTEKGDEAEGFYAGIRKLCLKEEVSAWMQLWPKETLE